VLVGADGGGVGSAVVLVEGAAEGSNVPAVGLLVLGEADGLEVGRLLWEVVGSVLVGADGGGVGSAVVLVEGAAEGSNVPAVGLLVLGEPDGLEVGRLLGEVDGSMLGKAVGSKVGSSGLPVVPSEKAEGSSVGSKLSVSGTGIGVPGVAVFGFTDGCATFSSVGEPAIESKNQSRRGRQKRV